MPLDSIKYRVVIPTGPDLASAGDKGKIFERLVGQFLKFQSYDVVSRLRDAGTEIDLLCKSRLNLTTAVVECKAQEGRLQSDVVNKLFADVSVNDAADGWIFSISDLGAEARTRLERLTTSDRRLRFFPSDELIRLLISAGALVEPKLPAKLLPTGELLLVLLPNRRIWTVQALDPRRQQPIGHLAWSDTGESISPNDCPRP